ncbi:hypothetical protein [Fimbriiglobus ruber]|uniref:Uncharacterized protein n=1 Tax=Fimbriiglobus ruber TaxID=1908690 RepID=A0A225DJ85_9BACT|nr:hypothetical protein [Fimbriiglobus ruber]OWK41003.1 hypothetical protein FRUB_04895 [Fimbriiglobus ruber]
MSTLGEVDLNVSEVGLATVAGGMVEGEEGLALLVASVPEVALDGVIAAGVVVLVDETSKDLGGGVALLRGGGLIGREDGIDDRLEGPEGGGRPWRRSGGRLWLGVS